MIVNRNKAIGGLPVGWKEADLIEVCDRIAVGLATSVTKYYRKAGAPIVRNLNIKNGYFDESDLLFLDPLFAQANKSKAAKGLDVLTVHTGANLGMTCVLPQKYHNCQTFTTLITTPKIKELDSFYLCYHMGSVGGRKEMDKLQVGGGKGNLNTGDLKRYRLKMPKLITEQRRIVEVLLDIDSLIRITEKLIAKKRAIKQGVMQELLTGKRRLPGFVEEWVSGVLPSVCWFQEGPGVRTYQFTRSGTKLLNGTNIDKNNLDLSSTERYISNKLANGMYSHFLVDESDIIIASSGITIDKFDEKVTIANKNHLPLCMNTSTIRFKTNKGLVIREFLYYFLQSNSFKEQIGGQATGSAQLNFGPSHLKKVVIAYPKKQEEQLAIIEIVADIDKEIMELENKLEKYKHVKQGAMQVLLTGKVRLVDN